MNQTVKREDVYLAIECNELYRCVRFENANSLQKYLSEQALIICDRLTMVTLEELRENYGFWPFDTGDCFFGFNCMRDFIESVMPYYGSKEYRDPFIFNDDYWKDEN